MYSIVRRGFTLVEVMIVVTIVAVLAGIILVVYPGIQAGARNDATSSQTTVLSEALEKYYEKNGEYPTCADMTAAPATISSNTLIGINPNVFTRVGGTSGTNSISCSGLTGSNLVYTPAASGLDYTLQYKEEYTGKTVTINSRHHQADEVASTVSGLSVAQSGANVVATANSTPCTTTSTLYSFRSQVNAGAWSAYSAWSTSNTTSQPGTQGYKYTYQVQTQCAGGSQVAAGPTASYIYPVSTPAAPTLLASLSGTSAVGTASATCPAGTTATYSLQSVERPSAGAGTWSAWTAYGPTTTISVTANAVWQYSFGAKVICTGLYASSSASPTTVSSTPTTVVTASGSTITATATADACTTGTLEYSFRNNINAGGWSAYDAWSSANTRTLAGNYGYQYQYQVQTRCTSAPDIEVGTASAPFVPPVPTPGLPTVTTWLTGNTVNFTISGAACPAGTVWNNAWTMLDRAVVSDTTWNAWSSYNTNPNGAVSGNPGWQYTIQGRVWCDGVYADSAEGPGQNGPSVVVPMSAPPTPSWRADMTPYFKSGASGAYKSKADFYWSCPAGAWPINYTYDSYPEWNTSTHWFHTWGYDDWWYTGSSSTQYVKYYSRYTCTTDFTSATSADGYSRIEVRP